MAQTNLPNETKVLPANVYDKNAKQLANFDDKHAKQEAKFKEYVNTIIESQDSKLDKKFETKLQTLSLQIKDI